MHIRLAKKKELAEIASLDQRVNKTPWSVLQYEACLANLRQKIYVLELDKVICGVLVVTVSFDEVEVLQLAVDYRYQRQRLATRLLQEVFSILDDKHLISKVFLEVCVDNYPALALYQKLGFSQISSRKDYYSINGAKFDACVMMLDYAKS
jgi:ribosomal-protein-alanine N-acetyltransferase